MSTFYVPKEMELCIFGVTSNLNGRMQEHKAKLISGFTAKYSVTHLVYFEVFDSALIAIRRKKCIKRWARA